MMYPDGYGGRLIHAIHTSHPRPILPSVHALRHNTAVARFKLRTLDSQDETRRLTNDCFGDTTEAKS